MRLSLYLVQALELWTKTVDAWQSSVKDTADARAEWTRQWTDTLANAKGTPEELRELARKGREEMQHWAEAERELWQGWFEHREKHQLQTEPGAGRRRPRTWCNSGKTSAHEMIDTQASLVRRWTGASLERRGIARNHGSKVGLAHTSQQLRPGSSHRQKACRADTHGLPRSGDE